VLGTRQSGLPELHQADLLKDHALLVQARQEAQSLIQADPDFRLPEHAALAAAVQRLFDHKIELGSVG
jgi:ATP-dependent DNA helicase RecG